MARPSNVSVFLRAVREAGGRIGNSPLRRSLDWSEDKYQKVKDELIDSGLIARGRGQGGSVILVVPETHDEIQKSTSSLSNSDQIGVVEELSVAQAVAVEYNEIREVDLYEPALREISRHWSRDKQLEHCVCEKTASQGRRDTGGSWSRPDLVAVGFRKFEYVPDRVIELYTFEIKAEYDISIKGVMEALSHREMANRSYVIYHTNGRNWEDFGEAQRIEQLAARHGVGVIVASKIDSFEECWEERVMAIRSPSDPESIDKFIKATLNEETKSRIRKWF